jgi:GNAT superfamily N-acetyltransferase
MNPQSRLRWTFAVTSLALFAVTLDRLVVATALPAIRAGLGAQAAGLAWTVNAYTLSYAVLLLTGSALGEDVLDLEKHANNGRWLVVEADGQILGSGAFYPDAALQGAGLPAGWASGRALAVHPAARGRGVARAMIAAVECLAADGGAPVFAFHTASFMTSAIALYERLGYQRAPEFDYSWVAAYGPAGAPITSIAYCRCLNPPQPRRIR